MRLTTALISSHKDKVCMFVLIITLCWRNSCLDYVQRCFFERTKLYVYVMHCSLEEVAGVSGGCSAGLWHQSPGFRSRLWFGLSNKNSLFEVFIAITFIILFSFWVDSVSQFKTHTFSVNTSLTWTQLAVLSKFTNYPLWSIVQTLLFQEKKALHSVLVSLIPSNMQTS